MSLSPMVDNNVLQVSETVDSTEIVVDQNDDFEQEKSKDWSQEEQMNNEDEGETMISDTLIPQSSMDNTLSRDSGEELIEEESPLDVEESTTEGRIVDQACTNDFNLDLDGDADLLDDHDGDGVSDIGYPYELDAAPELLEDFQSDDDYNAEEGIFNYADAGWG